MWCDVQRKPLTSVFKDFTMLKSLDLYDNDELSSCGLTEIADHCVQLEELNIDQVEVNDASIKHLITKANGRLRKLWISGGDLTDDSFGDLGKLAVTLELLSISDASMMGARGMRAISRLVNLESLTVAKTWELEDQDLARAFANGQLKKLVYLDLSSCLCLSDEVLITIGRNCPDLRALHLGKCPEITNSGLSSVAKSCKFLSLVNLAR
jgi:hypothetical protein